jgi:hypothetical protein
MAESLPGRKTVPWIFPLLLDETDNPQPERITFTGGCELGIFDPSIARDPETGRLWMSYSAVDESQFYVPSIYWGVSIRLAYSDDNGSTWQYAGVAVFMFSVHTVGPLNVTNPAPPIDTGSDGIWQSETSTLIYDPAASVEQDARTFLIVTPVDVTVGNRYDGCRAHEFADIDSAEPARNGGGQLIEIQRVSGRTGTHNGACAAYDGLQGGIIYSQFDPAEAP